MSYILYKKAFSSEKETLPYSVLEFKPSPCSPFLPQERKTFRLFLLRIYFWVITFGRFSLFYVLNSENELMHVSCVMGKNYKFPFMQNNELEIGPSVTYENFQKKGLYATVLKFVTSLEKFSQASFCMLVHHDNVASIKGIEKSGFKNAGCLHKSKYLKVYRKDEN